MSGEDGEEGHQWKWVIEVSEGIEEVGVSFSNQMIEWGFRFVSSEILDLADVAFGSGTFVLSEVNLLGSQFLDEWIEGEEVNVFQMIIGSVHFLEFFWRLSWVDALEDAQLSEILEGKLKFPDRFWSGDVLADLAFFAGLDFSHFYWLLIFIIIFLFSY